MRSFFLPNWSPPDDPARPLPAEGRPWPSEDYDDDDDDNAYDDIMIQYLESTASIFANVELDLGGKELNHHFPLSHGSLQVIVIIKLIIVVFLDFNFRSFTDVGLHQGIERTRVRWKTKSGLFIKLFKQDSWTLLHWTFGTLNIGGTLERFLNFGTNTHCGEKVLLFLEKTVTMFLH